MKRSVFGKVLWQNSPNEHPTVVLFAFAIYFHPAGRSCTTDLCVAVIELFGAFWGQKRTVKLVSLAGARWGFVPAAFVPGGEITVNCFERSERGKGSSSCGCLSLSTWGPHFLCGVVHLFRDIPRLVLAGLVCEPCRYSINLKYLKVLVVNSRSKL